MNGVHVFIASFVLLQYGRIVDIELKIPSRPPCFCFVEVFLYNLGSKVKIKIRGAFNSFFWKLFIFW